MGKSNHVYNFPEETLNTNLAYSSAYFITTWHVDNTILLHRYLTMKQPI